MTALPAGLEPASYTIDPAHSDATFSVRHAGISRVRGAFRDLAGTITVGSDVENSSVAAELKTESVSTGDENRDNHLRSADFFDAANYPELAFNSTSLVPSGDGYTLRGDLTIHGTTKPVELELEFNGAAVDPFGNARVGFTATTAISRKDFGLTWNAALETGGFLVGDKIAITLDISAIKQS